MTKEEAKKMLQAEKSCYEKQVAVSGCNHDCYACELCYEQGNMGEHIQALQIAIEIIEKCDAIMTENIEMFKETVKVVHNQYIEVLSTLEDTLHDGMVSGEVPIPENVKTVDALMMMHATINVACKALKDSCDAPIKTIESEMQK